MFLIVLGFFSLILALPRPVYLWVTSPGATLALVAGATLIPAISGRAIAVHTLRLFDRYRDDPGAAQHFFNRALGVLQMATGGLHAAILLTTVWLPLCESTPGIGQWPGVAGLLASGPFLLSIVLLWIAIYPADRAVREIAWELYLYRSKPVQPVWTLTEFLMFNLRHQLLFLLLPMALVLVARDIISLYAKPLIDATKIANLPDLLLGAAAGLVAIFAPLALRYIWITRRLPESPLRDKLQALSRRLGLRCREILVWQTGGMLVNAAIMGVFAPLRYVLLTDGMIAQMDDTKIEAVFGHEAGHAKRHHIVYFLLFALISGCMLTVFSVRTRGVELQTYQIASTLVGLILAAKWGVLFVWISRKFERQADLYGVHALEVTGVPCMQPCMVHTSDTVGDPARQTDAVCATCAHLFSNTLHDVAMLNGIAPEAPSLRHGSIESRSTFLQEVAGNPEKLRRFEATIAAIKASILFAAVTMSIWAGVELGIWRLLRELIAGAFV